MSYFVIVVVIVVIVIVLMRTFSKSASQGSGGTDSYTITSSHSDSVQMDPDLKRDMLKRNEEKWKIDFYGGDEFDRLSNEKIVRSDGRGGQWEGFRNYFRKFICASEDLVNEVELIDIHKNYESEYHPITQESTRLVQVNSIKRHIKNEMLGPLKDRQYDKDNKTWEPIDITGLFLRVRGQMIDYQEPFPHYVWNIVKGNPFNPLYAICRDYVKWTGTLSGAKTLFENIKKWEAGKIYRDNEPDSEYESGLWVNWNKIAINFLSLKTKLKRDSEEAVDWLKNTVVEHVISKQSFYEQFGEETEYKYSDKLLEKLSSFK